MVICALHRVEPINALDEPTIYYYQNLVQGNPTISSHRQHAKRCDKCEADFFAHDWQLNLNPYWRVVFEQVKE